MTKYTILVKSLELFANKGYFGTSMEDIARAVEIKKASLYSHYSGKESIFKAVFDSILEDYTDFIEDLTVLKDGEKTTEKLHDIFSRYVKNRINNTKMAFWDRYYYYPPDNLKAYIHEQTYQTEMAFVDKISTIVQKGMERGEIVSKDPLDVTFSFYYMMIGFALSIKFYDERDIDKDIARCTTVFLQGITLWDRRNV